MIEPGTYHKEAEFSFDRGIGHLHDLVHIQVAEVRLGAIERAQRHLLGVLVHLLRSFISDRVRELHGDILAFAQLDEAGLSNFLCSRSVSNRSTSLALEQLNCLTKSSCPDSISSGMSSNAALVFAPLARFV